MVMHTKLARFLEFLVARRRALRGVMVAVLVLLVAIDFVLESKYQRFPWDDIAGFGALYGFGSCILIVIVSKALGYLLLYRSEDYYDD